jgi:mycofactocin precursor
VLRDRDERTGTAMSTDVITEHDRTAEAAAQVADATADEVLVEEELLVEEVSIDGMCGVY